MILFDRTVFDHEPVAPLVLSRLHEYPLPVEAATMEVDLVLRGTVLQQVVGTLVPDRHRPRSVAVGDDTVEGEVLEGVILGVHREPALAALERRPLRYCPRREHTVHLQTHVPMEACRVMAMHDIAARRGLLRPLTFRLRRALEVAFALVLGEAHPLFSSPLSRRRDGAPFSRPQGGAECRRRSVRSSTRS